MRHFVPLLWALIEAGQNFAFVLRIWLQSNFIFAIIRFYLIFIDVLTWIVGSTI